METVHIARLMLEKVDQSSDEHKDDVQVFADRMIMRLFSIPSLLAYLSDVAITGDDTVEIEFFKLPDDVRDDLPKMFGSPEEVETEIVHYAKNDIPRVGYKIKLLDPLIKKKSSSVKVSDDVVSEL